MYLPSRTSPCLSPSPPSHPPSTCTCPNIPRPALPFPFLPLPNESTFLISTCLPQCYPPNPCTCTFLYAKSKSTLPLSYCHPYLSPPLLTPTSINPTQPKTICHPKPQHVCSDPLRLLYPRLSLSQPLPTQPSPLEMLCMILILTFLLIVYVTVCKPLLCTEAQGSLLSLWSRHGRVAHVRHMPLGVPPGVSRTPTVGCTPRHVELSTVQGTHYVYSVTCKGNDYEWAGLYSVQALSIAVRTRQILKILKMFAVVLCNYIF